MRICVFSDVHWSTTASIVRQRGKQYSVRLERLIDSMNWVNQVAIEQGCKMMLCAGDFMDKSMASDEELTALRQINWNSLPCYFLCGNHESSVADLRYSSLKALEAPNHIIVDQPQSIELPEAQLCLLPYITESGRQSLIQYFPQVTETPRILISHADIQGINYGGFESKLGFSVSEIENFAALCLNGHLHNTEHVTSKIINVGSLSAHNFTNDSFKYKYGLWILDTVTGQVNFLENPFGFSFYKVTIAQEKDLQKLTGLKAPAVLNIKCVATLVSLCKEFLQAHAADYLDVHISTLEVAAGSNPIMEVKDLHVDHLAKLIEFCKATLNNSSILEAELSEICK